MKEIITKNRSLLEETERLLNDQIKLEGVSSAIYRSMASWAEIKGFEHSAAFLYDHSEEEKMHMMNTLFLCSLNNWSANIQTLNFPISF